MNKLGGTASNPCRYRNCGINSLANQVVDNDYYLGLTVRQ
ncbi:hypothetical protein PLIP_b0832 [Pseudoalteromonas lipolytica LMEB 39]|nr:hypothetical protein [Pseudoalteromonas lipolytica LMEB 39]